MEADCFFKEIFICICKFKILLLRPFKNVSMKPMRRKAVESLYSDCLYISSGALARKVEKLAIEAWKPAGISPSHGYFLLLLLQQEMRYPSWLARDLLLSPSTVTRLMEKLEKMELIDRMPYERLTCIMPTQKAWDLEPILSKCQLDFERRCQEILGISETVELTTILNQATDKF